MFDACSAVSTPSLKIRSDRINRGIGVRNPAGRTPVSAKRLRGSYLSRRRDNCPVGSTHGRRAALSGRILCCILLRLENLKRDNVAVLTSSAIIALRCANYVPVLSRWTYRARGQAWARCVGAGGAGRASHGARGACVGSGGALITHRPPADRGAPAWLAARARARGRARVRAARAARARRGAAGGAADRVSSRRARLAR